MQPTPIGWTDFSSNLLKYLDADGNILHACVRISEGCRFCYACALAGRFGRKGKDFTAENMKALTPYFDTNEAAQILKSKKIAGKKVFVDDMTDLFGEWVSEEIILAHFTTFAARPDVTFQVLTKRAKRMCEVLTRWKDSGLTLREGCGAVLPNVHLGVSVEDTDSKLRLAYLRNTPAAVHWASLEPFLEHMEFDHTIAVLDGIVIGGETGGRYRAMPISSALTLARKAHESGVSVYFKQDSGQRPGMQGRIPDDVWAMKEWPEAA
jgi:protein gp37